MKLFFFGLLALVLVVVGSVAIFTFSHERAHQVIFREFNVSSHVEYGFPTSYTVPDQNFLNDEDWRAAYIAHGVNEAVGYQLAPLLIIIIAIQFAGLLLKIKKVK